jgi:hypothetical protein
MRAESELGEAESSGRRKPASRDRSLPRQALDNRALEGATLKKLLKPEAKKVASAQAVSSLGL